MRRRTRGVFNVGGPEIDVIILVALLVLGPEQLPKAMRTFGNVMTQVRKVSGGFQDELRSVMDSVTDGIDPTKPSKPAPSSRPAAPAAASTDADDKPHSAAAGRAGVEPPSAEAAELAPDVDPTSALVDRAAG